MMVEYSNFISDWSTSGSSKGELLLEYATSAYEILKKGKSVTLTADGSSEDTDSEQDITLSFFSGGTGGEPEKVTHSPSTLGFAVDGLINRIGEEPVNSLCCLPLWHVGGWMQLERAWRTGGKIIFCDYRDIASLRPSIVSEFWISLVPTQLVELLKDERAVDLLKCVKGIFVGGATISPHLNEKARESELPVFPCYGSSETAGMVTLLHSENFLNGIDGVGQCLSHAQIRLDPVTQIAEVQADSLCLSRGNQKYQRGDWLRTPDYCSFSENGNLKIHGRSDRIINTGGEKVSASQIEQILYSTGMVEQCLATGIPDEKWGARLVVYISPENIDLKEVQARTNELLKGCMKPKEWHLCQKIPFSDMGKPIASVRANQD